jgi:hypothetical protein
MTDAPFVAVVCSCGYEEKYRIHFTPSETELTTIEKYRTAEMVAGEWAAYCEACEEYRHAHLSMILDGAMLVIDIEAGDALVSREDIVAEFPEEHRDLVDEFVSVPHKHSNYVSVWSSDYENGEVVYQAEQFFRRTVARLLSDAVPATCTECNAHLSEADINEDGAAPEIGWTYCECPECTHRMSPEVVTYV